MVASSSDMSDLDYAVALSLQENLNHSDDSSICIDKKSERNDREALDFAVALSLQEEEKVDLVSQKTKPVELYSPGVLEKKWDRSAIVDSSWELTDPSPDIHQLFCDYDSMFFHSALTQSGVAVSWSDRMKLCAGVCQYEGRGGLCSIRLSQPLLQFRPRKNLVETLLHEMIHAYLFVTANNKDRESHGPEFIKHMERINKQTGANITVYHNYHAEVNLFRQHWWKCDGPCQSRPPFFGTVRRSTNRAPSHNDTWWAEHQRTCGGTFKKVKEPEGYRAKGKNNKSTTKQNDTKQGNIKQLLDGKGSGSSSKDKVPQTSIVPFAGKGHVLNSNASAKIVKGARKKDSGDSSGTVDLTVEVSMREKLLAAAENRLKVSEQRGKKKRRSPTGRGSREDPSVGSGDLRNIFKRVSSEATDSQPLKKTRTSDSDDCQVLDTATVKDNCTVLGKQTGASSTRVNDRTVSLHDPDMIMIEDDEDSLPASSQGSTGSSVPQKTCPVCLRNDIPETVLSIHVNLCLEEMELSDDGE